MVLLSQRLNSSTNSLCSTHLGEREKVDTDICNRTNNYCESFNETFSTVVGHANPTDTVYLQLRICCTAGAGLYTRQDLFLQELGIQPFKRKRQYMVKGAAMKNIASTYHQYKIRVHVYLDLLVLAEL